VVRPRGGHAKTRGLNPRIERINTNFSTSGGSSWKRIKKADRLVRPTGIIAFAVHLSTASRVRQPPERRQATEPVKQPSPARQPSGLLAATLNETDKAMPQPQSQPQRQKVQLYAAIKIPRPVLKESGENPATYQANCTSTARSQPLGEHTKTP